MVVAIIPNMLASLINAYPFEDHTIVIVVKVATYILRYGSEVIPSCAFLNALAEITSVEYDSLKDIYATKGIFFISTMFLIGDFILYFILSVVVEVLSNRALTVPQSSPAQEGSTTGETPDVSAARNRAESEADRDDLVIVKNLRKEFGRNFAAVKNLSMPIKVNECFGLLG